MSDEVIMTSMSNGLFQYKRMLILYQTAPKIFPIAFVLSGVYALVSYGHGHFESFIYWWAAYLSYAFVTWLRSMSLLKGLREEGYVEGKDYSWYETNWIFTVSAAFSSFWAVNMTFIFPQNYEAVFTLVLLVCGNMAAVTISHSVSKNSVLTNNTIYCSFLATSMFLFLSSLSAGEQFFTLSGVGAAATVLMFWLFTAKASADLNVNYSENIRLLIEREGMVNSLKDANVQITNAQSQLEASTRLAAVGEMSASMAHEFNNPLAVVKAASETIELKLDMKKDLADFEGDFFLINKNIKRIVGIIDSFKILTLDGEGVEESDDIIEFNASDIASAVTKRFLNLDINFDVAIKPGLSVKGSPAHFEQILIGLINNAIDAVDDQNERNISIALGNDKGFIELVVEDNGKGVDKSIRSQIFEPFFTTKSRKDGLGMGLSISSSLAKSMGARVYLDQASGSRFVLEFKPDIGKQFAWGNAA